MRNMRVYRCWRALQKTHSQLDKLDTKMNKKNNNRIKFGLLIVGIALLLIFGVKWIIQFVRIDSCLDKGGKWNYNLKKCECYSIDTSRITDYYWDSDFDTITNREYLKRGKMLDSIAKSPNELIEILNMRPSKCKIDYVEKTGDTLKNKDFRRGIFN